MSHSVMGSLSCTGADWNEHTTLSNLAKSAFNLQHSKGYR